MKAPATDVQAVLTVIVRRRVEHDAKGQGLDLSFTDLREAALGDAHLEGAILQGAHLEGANLIRAHLKDADLTRAHLEGAKLYRANLEGADLTGTDVTQKQLDLCWGDERTKLPEGLTIRDYDSWGDDWRLDSAQI